MFTELIQSEEVKDIIISERMNAYEASFNFNKEKAPDRSYFSNIIQHVSPRDNIKITLQNEGEDIYYISTENMETYNEFISNTLDEELISVKIKIDKQVVNNHFSIYSFDDFVKDILSLSLDKVMIAFSNLLKQSQNFLIFDIYSQSKMFATETMVFLPYADERIDMNFNRTQRLEDCRKVSYFYNFDIYEILPDDFKITNDYENNPLTELFQKIMVLLSINFIATSSTLSESQIKGTISSQHTMEYCCEINDLPNNKILYNIYNWIYTGGNPIDKAIIARNAIGLHCKYVSITEIDEKVMASIQSNYNLYLKDNVKEYLELRNKVAEFISGTLSKTGEYATNLLDKFKSNMVAVFSFLFSIVLVNIISEQPLNNIFTNEIAILLSVVIAGSLGYLIICYRQSCFEIQKVRESYDYLKQNYKDVLTENDLNEIFDNDKLLNEMTNTINKLQKKYVFIWVALLIILFIIIEYLTYYFNY